MNIYEAQKCHYTAVILCQNTENSNNGSGMAPLLRHIVCTLPYSKSVQATKFKFGL